MLYPRQQEEGKARGAEPLGQLRLRVAATGPSVICGRKNVKAKCQSEGESGIGLELEKR